MKAPMWPLLLVTACDTELDESAPEAPVDYSEAGPFIPGTLESTLVGSTGIELNIQVWYPSSEPGDQPIRYDSLWEGEAFEGLEAACDDVRPVLMFSHGWGGVRWQSPFLTEHLASHGYVVVAPDHTHNTFLDDDYTYFDSVVTRRPVDISDSFDWLVAQSEDPTSELRGCMDPDDGFAVSGHSFGGYTSFAISGAEVHDPQSDQILDLSDPRVWATLALAPWDVDDTITAETMAGVFSPVMTLSGTRDQNTTWDQVTDLHGGLEIEPRYLGEFPNAGHSNFAPVACFIFTDEDGCGEDFIAEEIFIDLVRTSALSFLESTRGDDDAISQLPEAGPELIWETVD